MHQVDLLVLNFSKAIDTVAHSKLLHKLRHYGIQSNTHQWIATWLTPRGKERNPKIKGAIWSIARNRFGTLYDIDTEICSSLCLFADDCIVYRIIKTPDNHHESIQWQMKYPYICICSMYKYTDEKKLMK